MLIFYCCYGRAHSSVVAAALHLEQLSVYTPTAISKLQYFDQATAQDMGIPKLVGIDTAGNLVFVLGRGPATILVENTLKSVLLAGGVEEKHILFIDLQPHLNFCTRLGGFLSRRLGFVFLGRQLAAYGIWCALGRIEDCVYQAKILVGLDV